MEIFKKCSNKEEYKNYPHQAKIAEILDEMNELERFSTIVTVPTGGGKTKIAADFCIKVLKTEGNKVLWLSDSIDLLIQSIERFQDMNMFRDVNYQLICSTAVYDDLTREQDQKSKKKRINEDAKEIGKIVDDKGKDADIVFASVDTLINADKGELGKWFEKVQEQGKVYIIYDEVHHIGAEKTDKFFEWLLRGVEEGSSILSNFGLIGLTATVYRYDSPVQKFNKWFKNGYDEKSGITPPNGKYGVGSEELINNRIEVVSISELIEQGLLMKPDIFRVDDFEDGLPEDKMDYLAKKISKNYKTKKWNKTIIFVDGKTNANDLQKKLDKDIPCFVYTSDTATDVGADLKNFKEKKSAKVMIAVDMVSEGFDVKDIETIYMFSKVESHILLRQRVGRVLRIAEGKNKATVYWQNYFDYTKKQSGHYKGSIESDVEEDDAEIQRDIGRYRKGMQLPAGMYLEKLPLGISEGELYRRYEYLRVLELFGLDIVLTGVGYYEINNANIYARQREKNGYEQFHRIIRSDYFSLLMQKDKYLKFSDYAKALGVSEQDLLDDIKINCFYMSNASVKDTNGNLQKKSFIVKDADIKAFYEWVVKNDLRMPEYHEISSSESNNENENTNDKDKQNDKKPDVDTECAKIAEYMKKEGIAPSGDLLGGIKLHQDYVRYAKSKLLNKPKVYPDMLTYGKNEVTYNEMLSVRALMSVGAVAQQREIGALFGVTGELALIGLTNDEKYEIKPVLARSVSDKSYENDLLLYAQTLITVPNHIGVKDSDVDEYVKCLQKSEVKSAVSEEADWNKITREFIMALGLTENDDIIRAQCKLFSGKLPRLLQYVIYCKSYERLSEKIEFLDSQNRVYVNCKNEEKLQKLYNEILLDFGVEQLDADLTPVDDVISDCMPYVKVIPYYQGIKPEFLCRMLNDMLRLGNKQNYHFIDSFGGSGTISMNIDAGLGLQQTYNDLGILNNALFEVVKADKGVRLKARVVEFIDLILNHTGDEKAALAFLEPYMGVLSKVKSKDDKYDFKNICLSTIEQKYRDKYNGDVDDHNSKTNIKHKWLPLADRLLQKERDYRKILAVTYENVAEDDLRKFEEYLHAILLILNRVFDEIKEKEECEIEAIDLAFLFFVYHSMSARHFYNDAIIDKFANFIGTYEQAIDNCAEILQKIEIVRGKAEELLVARSGINECVWYHDIPYSETSISTYSSDWFDEPDFVKKLGTCEGDYIIASRFNICEARKGNLDLVVSKEIEKDDAIKNKEKNIIKFFGRFVSEDFAKRYEDLVRKKFPEEDTDDEDYKDPKGKKHANPWTQIDDDKVAKYICFAFSQTEAIKSNDENKEVEYVKNHANISKDSIRRMLKNTQISNIEVEIMLTNMDLDMGKMPVVQIEEEGELAGIWYVPTFKTQSTYKVEPVTIIMEYEKFMMDMVVFLLAENVYIEEDARASAAVFRNLYSKK